jgi:ketosteroid isomerase-like protein
MASRRAAVVSRIWELFNLLAGVDSETRNASAGKEELLDHFDPEVEFTQPSDQPDRDTFRGRQALWDIWDEWLTLWTEHRSEIEKILEQGDRILVISRDELVGRDNISVDYTGGSIFTFRGDKITRFDAYLNHEAARRALESEAG